MAKRFLLGYFLFFAINTLNAQTRTLQGTVTDQKSKTPLIGASVVLRSLTDSSAQRMITDSSGIFTFTNLNRDSFLLSISFVGYNPVSRKVRIDSTDISLSIAAVTNTSS